MNPATAAALAPAIIQANKDLRRRMRPIGYILLAGALGGGGYFAWKAWKKSQAFQDLATNPNARSAAMYMKVLDQGTLLDRIIAKLPGVKEVNTTIDTVTGWFGKSKSEKVNLITAQLLNWDECVKYYKAYTGKSLNKSLKDQLSEKEYESFVNTLGANRNAGAAAAGKQNLNTIVDERIAKMVQLVMSKPPGTTWTIGNSGNVQNWKVTAAKPTSYWQKPGGGRKSLTFKPGDFLGNPTGRFHNHQNKLALVEFRTKEGMAWGILGDHTIWTPKS